MHLITGRNVQEHQILLAVINLPYIVKGGERGREGQQRTQRDKYDGWQGLCGKVRVHKGYPEPRWPSRAGEYERRCLEFGLRPGDYYGHKQSNLFPDRLFLVLTVRNF